MICQILDWLAGDAGTIALRFAMATIGCALAYNSAARWWKTSGPQQTDPRQPKKDSPREYRRAA
jgi:hypothetical protein